MFQEMEGGAGFQMTSAEVEPVSELPGQIDEDIRSIIELSKKIPNSVDGITMFIVKPAKCTKEDLFILKQRRYDEFDELESYARIMRLKWEAIDISTFKWFGNKDC
jgi:hypothetical protein